MTLSLTLSQCGGLSPDNRGGLELIQLLKNTGVVFLPLACSPEIDPHPELRVGASGTISQLLGVEHPLIGKGLGHDASGRPRPHGSANMTFTGPHGSVSIAQVTDDRNAMTWPPLAESLWQFANLIHPILKPDYAHLDRLGRDSWTDVRKLELKYLFWRNLFGPRYVDKYGRNFFLSAPGVCTEHSDGSVEYSPEPSYLDWVTKPTGTTIKDAVKYFRQKFPKIKQYPARPVELPYEIVRMVGTDESGVEKDLYKRADDQSAVGESD